VTLDVTIRALERESPDQTARNTQAIPDVMTAVWLGVKRSGALRTVSDALSEFLYRTDVRPDNFGLPDLRARSPLGDCG